MEFNMSKFDHTKLGLIGSYIFGIAVMTTKAGMNIALGLMFLGFIFSAKLFKKRVELEKEQKFFFILLITTPLFSLFSPGGIESFSVALEKSYRYLPIFFIPIFLVSYKEIEKLIIYIYISMFGNFINGMLRYKRYNWNFGIRYESFSNNLLDNAHVFMFLSFFVLATIIYFYNKKKIYVCLIGGIVYIIDLIALLLSQSRGAWLSFIVVMGVFFFLIIKNKKILCGITILGLLVGTICLQNKNISNNRYIKRFKSIKNLESDSPKIRLLMWEGAIETYKENPIFGSGRDNSSSFILEYFDKNNKYSEVKNKDMLKKVATAGNPHNMYFSSISEEGLGSLILFGFWLYILMNEYLLFMKLNKKNKIEKYLLIGCLCSTIGFYLCGMTENAWRNFWKANAYILIIGIYLSIKRIEISENDVQ